MEDATVCNFEIVSMPVEEDSAKTTAEYFRQNSNEDLIIDYPESNSSSNSSDDDEDNSENVDESFETLSEENNEKLSKLSLAEEDKEKVEQRKQTTTAVDIPKPAQQQQQQQKIQKIQQQQQQQQEVKEAKEIQQQSDKEKTKKCVEKYRFSCRNCDIYFANSLAIESKQFVASTGQAYLFNQVYNVSWGPAKEKVMLTGRHLVSDAFCKECKKVIGWMYQMAYLESQEYKNGKTVIEFAKMQRKPMD